MNCWLLPSGMEGLNGATEMETKNGVTLNKVELDFPDDEAVIVVVPAAAVLATPLLLIEATGVLLDFQTTDPEMSAVLPSLNVPVAANC